MLLVVEKPGRQKYTPDCAVLMPVEAEVDNEVRLLLVVERPVDSRSTPELPPC